MSTKTAPMKTLVIGHVTHDHYQEGLVAGGCAYYGAMVHARLSGTTHLVALVGEDFICDDALKDLSATVHRSGKTTVFANYYPPDAPRIQLLEAMADNIYPHHIPAGFEDADLVHLAPVLSEIELSAWDFSAFSGLVAINVQGWIKVAGDAVDAEDFERFQQRGVGGKHSQNAARRVVQKPWTVRGEQLAGIDIACLSEEDIIGQGDLLERLIAAIPVVALTLGEHGSRIYVDGQPTEVGIYPTEIVDPTGAGDVFAAMFTHKIAEGLLPSEAARFGAAASSIVIEDIGARALFRPDFVQELERRAQLVG